MKLILDLDDKIIDDLQTYADIQNKSVSEVLSKLFNDYVKEPVDVIDNHDQDTFNDFVKIMTSYLNESILDMEELIGTEEENEDDASMVEVYKELNRDLILDPRTITKLFQTYLRTKNKI